MQTTKNPPTVFGYCRVSTQSQEDNTSLQNQQDSIKAYCRSQNWHLARIFVDIATGKDFDRPQFKKMEEHLSGIKGIVCYKIDRFSRSLLDGYPKILEYESKEIFFKSVTEPFIDTTNAMSRSMLRSMFNFVQTERELIVERMLKGKACNATKGRFNGSPIIYGYRYTPGGEKDFEVNPDQAKIIRTLFSLYSTGRYSLRKLKLRTGCPLSHVQIGNLLSNVFFTGRISYNGQIQWNEHERIVGDRLFNRVQKMRAQKSKTGSAGFFKVIENKAQIAEIC